MEQDFWIDLLGGVIRGSINKYQENVISIFIFSTKFIIYTLLFVKTYFYFMRKVSLDLIQMC